MQMDSPNGLALLAWLALTKSSSSKWAQTRQSTDRNKTSAAMLERPADAGNRPTLFPVTSSNPWGPRDMIFTNPFPFQTACTGGS